MLQYQNQDELDKARLEWFALAEERRQVCYIKSHTLLTLALYLWEASLTSVIGKDRPPKKAGRCAGKTQRMVESRRVGADAGEESGNSGNDNGSGVEEERGE